MSDTAAKSRTNLKDTAWNALLHDCCPAIVCLNSKLMKLVGPSTECVSMYISTLASGPTGKRCAQMICIYIYEHNNTLHIVDIWRDREIFRVCVQASNGTYSGCVWKH